MQLRQTEKSVLEMVFVWHWLWWILMHQFWCFEKPFCTIKKKKKKNRLVNKHFFNLNGTQKLYFWFKVEIENWKHFFKRLNKEKFQLI